MKITSKGQVTIPQAIRDRFGFKPGTDIDFVPEGKKVVLRKKARRVHPVDAWLAGASGVAKGRVTTQSILRLTRGED